MSTINDISKIDTPVNFDISRKTKNRKSTLKLKRQTNLNENVESKEAETTQKRTIKRAQAMTQSAFFEYIMDP